MNELDKIKALVPLSFDRSDETTTVPGFEGIHRHKDALFGQSFIRGRSNVMSYEEVRGLSKIRTKPDEHGTFWGGVYIPLEDATNFCVIGIPGSGKTTLIRLMMQSVLPLIGLKDKNKANAQKADPRYYAAKYGVADDGNHAPKIETHRALIFDIKPEYLFHLKGMNLNSEVKILDPYHADGCVWDLGKDVNEFTIPTFAAIFIPDKQSKSGKEQFFPDAARDVVTLALTALHRKRGQDFTFCDFVKLMEDEAVYTKLIHSFPDLSRGLRQSQARAETFQNVVQQIRTVISRIQPASKAWSKSKNKVSLKDWCEREYILLLSRQADYRKSVDPIYQLVFGVAAALTLSYPDGAPRRTWFFLDELGNAGELADLPELMSLGRSKNVSVVIGAQGIPTIQRVFKADENVNEILELCAYMAILRVGDSGKDGTASWAEALLGKCEFYETKKGLTLSKAYTSGTTVTETDGTSNSASDSTTTGTNKSLSSTLTAGSSRSDTNQEGEAFTKALSYGPSSSSESQSYTTNNSYSLAQSSSSSRSDGATEGESQSFTHGTTYGTNRSTARGESESETESMAITVNRERLEKPLVQASQIASLKTLKYDGVLVGYFINPFSTYALFLPGLYLGRALQQSQLDPTLYATIPLAQISGVYHDDSNEDELLQQRADMVDRA